MLEGEIIRLIFTDKGAQAQGGRSGSTTSLQVIQNLSESEKAHYPVQGNGQGKNQKICGVCKVLWAFGS